MTNVYSFCGAFVFGLLLICTCSYIRRIPKLKQMFLSEKKGIFGVLYKASVIGTKLHIPVSLTCIFMSIYILVLS
uniref:Protein kish n=1 Tax=Strigamia maritima TaxID=126957 RepID=T1J9Y3_STRMM